MVLDRLFGRKQNAPAAQPLEPEAPVVDEATNADDDHDDDASPEVAADRTWRERADVAVAGGASTGSKRHQALYGDTNADLPTHFVAARGAHITDVQGNRYLDCTMALGAVALGYAEQRVTAAAVEAASEGSVSGWSSWREVELAERLRVIIPCAEKVQVLKSGAEATSAAVRLARAYTGRSHVVACGYFGWHDWWSSGPGIPDAVSALCANAPFDDIAALERAVQEAGTDLAAIVIEPVVERAPSIEWLQRARALCDSTGAALIFDEVKTGFRVAPGGWQEVSGVTPDLAAFGKALANGYPLAVVVGHNALMDAGRSTWISSTLASDSVSLAAALAVLDWHEEADVCASLGETGVDMRGAVDRAIEASGLEGVSTDGIDQMWQLRWNDPALESQFIANALHEGVLFKRGAYNFAAMAHDEAAIRTIERAASAALVSILESLG